jgi:hypothetical protein
MPSPNTQGWALVGLFGLAFYIFTLIAFNPLLANVQLFGVLATAVITGGLGGALGFYFGSSKSSEAKDAVIAKAADKGQ